MSTIYDNWERLVNATLRREQLWQMFHSHSRTPSSCSTASDFSYSSQLSDCPFDFSSPSSWYQQNRVSEIGIHEWGYNVNDLEASTDNFKELAPGDIFVNGEPLGRRELIMLQRCAYPPKKLKPGSYWYDKQSGFWGKQGHKPSEIISAHLDLGGFLGKHASNGNTLVYMNGRQITRVELRLLQFVGVKCYQGTHFRIYEDGSYRGLQEAGRPIRGSIWDKAGMKLLCSLLSLPFPRNSSNLSVPEYIERTPIQKILLIGCSGSGTSTIFKQAVFLYKDIPFLEEELEQIKLLIQSNIYSYIRILLEGHKQFEEEILNELKESQSTDEHGLTEFADASDKTSIHPFGPRLKAFSDWILQFIESSSSGVFSASFIQATAPLIEQLWRNPTFQETFMRRSELQRLHSGANYFLARAVHIFKPDYEPSNMDILCAEWFPSSLSYVDFSFPPPRDDEFDIWDQQDFTTRYQLIRPDGPGDNELPFDMFGDVRIVIFSVSLCDYDELVVNDQRSLVNKMIYNRQWFKSTVTNPVFHQKGFLLLLTKYDLFEEKIERIPLNQCDWFGDFRPVPLPRMAKVSLGERGFHYVAVKFKTLYTALTGRKLYVAKVSCLNQHSVDVALRYARDILKWEEEMSQYAYTDYSSDSSFYSDDS